MKRATVIVKGEVQRVGYRDIVEKIARKLKLVGFVENLKPYDVKIIAEGEEEALKKFVEFIDIKKSPIDVEKVVVRFEEPSGEYEYFEIKRGEWQDELGERMDVAGKVLFDVRDGLFKLREGQRDTSEKQDKTIEMTREGAEETKKLRNDNREFHNKSIQMSDKLDSSFHSFHKDTIARFDVVDDKSRNMCDIGGFQAFSSTISFRCDEKYGKISENIEKAVYAINRTCDNTEKLLEKSERDRDDYRKSMDNLVGAIVKLAEKK